MKRAVFHLVWDKREKCWVVRRGKEAVSSGGTKATMLKAGRRLARAAEPSQLIVHTKKRIQFEHTYPRSSDPRRYKS